MSSINWTLQSLKCPVGYPLFPASSAPGHDSPRCVESRTRVANPAGSGRTPLTTGIGGVTFLSLPARVWPPHDSETSLAPWIRSIVTFPISFRTLQDPSYSRMYPLGFPGLRRNSLSAQLVGYSLVRPSLRPQSFLQLDYHLFVWLRQQSLARWVCRIKLEAVRYSTGPFASSDLLLQHFLDPLGNLFALKLGKGCNNGQAGPAHGRVRVDLLGDRNEVPPFLDEEILHEFQ